MQLWSHLFATPHRHTSSFLVRNKNLAAFQAPSPVIRFYHVYKYIQFKMFLFIVHNAELTSQNSLQAQCLAMSQSIQIQLAEKPTFRYKSELFRSTGNTLTLVLFLTPPPPTSLHKPSEFLQAPITRVSTSSYLSEYVHLSVIRGLDLASRQVEFVTISDHKF